MNQIYEVILKIECNCKDVDEFRKFFEEFLDIKEYSVWKPYDYEKKYSPIKFHYINLIESIGEIPEGLGRKCPCYKNDCNGIIAWNENLKDFTCIKCGVSERDRK